MSSPTTLQICIFYLGRRFLIAKSDGQKFWPNMQHILCINWVVFTLCLMIYCEDHLLHAISTSQLFFEAVHGILDTNIDQEFLNFKTLAKNPTSKFSLEQGLLVKLIGDRVSLIIPEDTLQLKQIVFYVFHTLPLKGHLGHRKLLELV